METIMNVKVKPNFDQRSEKDTLLSSPIVKANLQLQLDQQAEDESSAQKPQSMEGSFQMMDFHKKQTTHSAIGAHVKRKNSIESKQNKDLVDACVNFQDERNGILSADQSSRPAMRQSKGFADRNSLLNQAGSCPGEQVDQLSNNEVDENFISLVEQADNPLQSLENHGEDDYEAILEGKPLTQSPPPEEKSAGFQSDHVKTRGVRHSLNLRTKSVTSDGPGYVISKKTVKKGKNSTAKKAPSKIQDFIRVESSNMDISQVLGANIVKKKVPQAIKPRKQSDCKSASPHLKEVEGGPGVRSADASNSKVSRTSEKSQVLNADASMGLSKICDMPSKSASKIGSKLHSQGGDSEDPEGTQSPEKSRKGSLVQVKPTVHINQSPKDITHLKSNPNFADEDNPLHERDHSGGQDHRRTSPFSPFLSKKIYPSQSKSGFATSFNHISDAVAQQRIYLEMLQTAGISTTFGGVPIRYNNTQISKRTGRTSSSLTKHFGDISTDRHILGPVLPPQVHQGNEPSNRSSQDPSSSHLNETMYGNHSTAQVLEMNMLQPWMIVQRMKTKGDYFGSNTKSRTVKGKASSLTSQSKGGARGRFDQSELFKIMEINISANGQNIRNSSKQLENIHKIQKTEEIAADFQSSSIQHTAGLASKGPAIFQQDQAASASASKAIIRVQAIDNSSVENSKQDLTYNTDSKQAGKMPLSVEENTMSNDHSKWQYLKIKNPDDGNPENEFNSVIESPSPLKINHYPAFQNAAEDQEQEEESSSTKQPKALKPALVNEDGLHYQSNSHSNHPSRAKLQSHHHFGKHRKLGGKVALSRQQSQEKSTTRSRMSENRSSSRLKGSHSGDRPPSRMVPQQLQNYNTNNVYAPIPGTVFEIEKNHSSTTDPKKARSSAFHQTPQTMTGENSKFTKVNLPPRSSFNLNQQRSSIHTQKREVPLHKIGTAPINQYESSNGQTYGVDPSSQVNDNTNNGNLWSYGGNSIQTENMRNNRTSLTQILSKTSQEVNAEEAAEAAQIVCQQQTVTQSAVDTSPQKQFDTTLDAEGNPLPVMVEKTTITLDEEPAQVYQESEFRSTSQFQAFQKMYDLNTKSMTRFRNRHKLSQEKKKKYNKMHKLMRKSQNQIQNGRFSRLNCKSTMGSMLDKMGETMAELPDPILKTQGPTNEGVSSSLHQEESAHFILHAKMPNIGSLHPQRFVVLGSSKLNDQSKNRQAYCTTTTGGGELAPPGSSNGEVKIKQSAFPSDLVTMRLNELPVGHTRKPSNNMSQNSGNLQFSQAQGRVWSDGTSPTPTTPLQQRLLKPQERSNGSKEYQRLSSDLWSPPRQGMSNFYFSRGETQEDSPDLKQKPHLGYQHAQIIDAKMLQSQKEHLSSGFKGSNYTQFLQEGGTHPASSIARGGQSVHTSFGGGGKSFQASQPGGEFAGLLVQGNPYFQSKKPTEGNYEFIRSQPDTSGHNSNVQMFPRMESKNPTESASNGGMPHRSDSNGRHIPNSQHISNGLQSTDALTNNDPDALDPSRRGTGTSKMEIPVRPYANVQGLPQKEQQDGKGLLFHLIQGPQQLGGPFEKTDKTEAPKDCSETPSLGLRNQLSTEHIKVKKADVEGAPKEHSAVNQGNEKSIDQIIKRVQMEEAKELLSNEPTTNNPTSSIKEQMKEETSPGTVHLAFINDEVSPNGGGELKVPSEHHLIPQNIHVLKSQGATMIFQNMNQRHSRQNLACATAGPGDVNSIQVISDKSGLGAEPSIMPKAKISRSNLRQVQSQQGHRRQIKSIIDNSKSSHGLTSGDDLRIQILPAGKSRGETHMRSEDYSPDDIALRQYYGLHPRSGTAMQPQRFMMAGPPPQGELISHSQTLMEEPVNQRSNPYFENLSGPIDKPETTLMSADKTTDDEDLSRLEINQRLYLNSILSMGPTSIGSEDSMQGAGLNKLHSITQSKIRQRLMASENSRSVQKGQGNIEKALEIFRNMNISGLNQHGLGQEVKSKMDLILGKKASLPKTRQNPSGPWPETTWQLNELLKAQTKEAQEAAKVVLAKQKQAMMNEPKQAPFKQQPYKSSMTSIAASQTTGPRTNYSKTHARTSQQFHKTKSVAFVQKDRENGGQQSALSRLQRENSLSPNAELRKKMKSQNNLFTRGLQSGNIKRFLNSREGRRKQEFKNFNSNMTSKALPYFQQA